MSDKPDERVVEAVLHESCQFLFRNSNLQKTSDATKSVGNQYATWQDGSHPIQTGGIFLSEKKYIVKKQSVPPMSPPTNVSPQSK